MAHMNTLKAKFSEDLRGLICHITSLNVNSPAVKRYEDTVLSDFAYRSFPTVSKRDVLATVDGLVDKFRTHGFPEKARNLKKLVERYVQSDYFKKHAKSELAQWSILSLIIQLSYKPTDVLQDDDPISLSPLRQSPAPSSLSDIDWPTYLRQGSEKFELPSSSSDDNSIWELTDDEDASVEGAGSTLNVPTRSSLHTQEVEPVGRGVQRTFQEYTEDRRRLALLVKEQVEAEDWLSKNVQLGWWNDTRLKDVPPSRHPLANTFFIWEDMISADPTGDVKKGDIRVLTEYKVTREIVWLLYSPGDCTTVKKISGQYYAREDVTISSLLPPVFKYFLDTEVCPYLTMIEALNEFQTEMLHSDPFAAGVSNTYLAYGSALGEVLQDYTEKLSEVESTVSKQVGVTTMTYVLNEVRPWLRWIEFVYKLHREAIPDDWKMQENWICAVRLLTVLFNHLARAINDWEKKTLLALFVNSFRPYAYILAVWLGEARLFDAKYEYFITRSQDVTCGTNLTVRNYSSQLRDSGISNTEFLDSIAGVTFRAVSSIEFLVQLEKDSEVRRECLSSGAIFNKFIAGLGANLMAYSFPKDAKKDGHQEGGKRKKRRNVLPSLYRGFEGPPGIQELKIDRHSIIHSKDYFRDGLAERPFDLYTRGPDQVFFQLTPTQELMESLESRDISTTLTHAFIIREVYDATVKYMRPAGFAGDILLREYGLMSQLEVLRGVFLLQAGWAMHAFANELFHEMAKENLWSVSWTEKLVDFLDEEMPRHSSRFSVVLFPKLSSVHRSILNCITYIELHYQPGSPVCLIVTEPILKEYNIFFQFFMQLKWSLYTLQKLRPRDFILQETTSVRRLYSVRLWLLHTVSVLHRYLMCVPASSFEKRIEQVCSSARDLQTIVAAYKEAIESWKHHCFLTEGHPCRDVIQTVFRICERLRLLWYLGKSNLLIPYQLDEIEANYEQAVNSLANVVQELEAGEGSEVRLSSPDVSSRGRTGFGNSPSSSADPRTRSKRRQPGWHSSRRAGQQHPQTKCRLMEDNHDCEENICSIFV